MRRETKDSRSTRAGDSSLDAGARHSCRVRFSGAFGVTCKRRTGVRVSYPGSSHSGQVYRDA